VGVEKLAQVGSAGEGVGDGGAVPERVGGSEAAVLLGEEGGALEWGCAVDFGEREEGARVDVGGEADRDRAREGVGLA
jgi:hypothetical protein